MVNSLSSRRVAAMPVATTRVSPIRTRTTPLFSVSRTLPSPVGSGARQTLASVTPQSRIRRLQVTYQDLSVLDFQFDQEKLKPPLDARLFQFELPSGAMVEEVVN